MIPSHIEPDLFGKDFMAVDRAILELFKRGVGVEDFSELRRAFNHHTAWDIRTDLIDLIALIAEKGSLEAVGFLENVAKGRGHRLVRYWAMMSLIELGNEAWKPQAKAKTRTDYYASLFLFERFVRKEIGIAEVHEMAGQRMKKRGDPWEWLTHLTEGGRWDRS